MDFGILYIKKLEGVGLATYSLNSTPQFSWTCPGVGLAFLRNRLTSSCYGNSKPSIMLWFTSAFGSILMISPLAATWGRNKIMIQDERRRAQLESQSIISDSPPTLTPSSPPSQWGRWRRLGSGGPLSWVQEGGEVAWVRARHCEREYSSGVTITQNQ